MRVSTERGEKSGERGFGSRRRREEVMLCEVFTDEGAGAMSLSENFHCA